MSAAGRPTFNPAKGNAEQGGYRRVVATKQYSVKDVAAHTKLKVRQPGQLTQEELKNRDFKAELLEREARHYGTKIEPKKEEEVARLEDQKIPQIEDRKTEVEELEEDVDADDKDLDADDSSSDESSSDDEDEQEELMRELDRIKKEREEEAKKLEQEALARQQEERTSQMLSSNPILKQDSDADSVVRKRWYDDAIFKNQAKGELKSTKRFVNDTIRNDFHRKFLTKYIQ
eukprot:TRINITY_DN3417_c0_g1_i1.p1 TRINITY_DN3417_c0_g1~~TRINITY_DN3417_c0_g1_i1.p1  ORF type:complete len:241 (-),score=87.78 TRINITY_DN3417_c0_g1_i1:106-798(-)